MAYSSYASDLSGYKKNIDSLSSSIEAIDMSSSWNGSAYKKQYSNVETLLRALNEQNGYIDSLVSALKLIDEYDNAKDLESQYQYKLNNLDTKSSTYQNDFNYLLIKRNSSRDNKNNLKEQINGILNSISKRYNESLNEIGATDIVNTVDAFNTVDELFSSINDSFDISKSVVTLRSLSEANMYPDFNDSEAWVTNNPYSMSGLYGQCTWFAWGRFYEIYGYSPGFTGNGNQCARQLLKAHGDKFYESTTPVAGAVFSQGLGEKYGHVGIVLAVDEANDTITIQDGNYNGTTDSFAVAQSDWGTKTMSLSEFCAKRGGAIFACPKEGA